MSKNTLDDIWNELNKKKIYFCYSPPIQDCIRLTVGYEFEPHGRASEDFELIWKLKLCCVSYYWKSTSGWKKGEGKGMEFKGMTYQEVIDKAFKFLTECNFEISDE